MGNPIDYPVSWVPFSISSVYPSFSNLENNPHPIPYFSYFTRVENLLLKQRFKQKLHIILFIIFYKRKEKRESKWGREKRKRKEERESKWGRAKRKRKE